MYKLKTIRINKNNKMELYDGGFLYETIASMYPQNEEYKAYHFDGTFENFEKIFNKCKPRLNLLYKAYGTNDLDKYNKYYCEDGLYSYNEVDAYNVWSCDDAKTAFLKLCNINSSFSEKAEKDVSKRWAPYLPYPYVLKESKKLSFGILEAGDYLVIKLARSPGEYGMVYSIDERFINDISIDEEDA